jgi:hypothetical protein
LGLAASIRITALIIIIPIVIAHLLVAKNKDGKKLINFKIAGAFVVLIISFLLVNPDWISNYGVFIKNHLVLIGIVNPVSTPGITYIGSEVSGSFQYYLTRGLPQALGWGFYLISLAGLGYSLVKIKTYQSLLLSIFPIIFIVIISRTQIVAPRYLIPVIPFILLVGARLLKVVIDRIIRGRIYQSLILGVVGVGFSIAPVVNVIEQNIINTQISTIELSRQWILYNVPDGARVAAESMGYYGPDLKLNRVLYYELYNLNRDELLAEYNRRQEEDAGGSLALKYFIDHPPNPKYYLINLYIF